MPSPYSPIDPKQNCVVSASAGTGKTWLLVSRIVRLLLANSNPGNIVAITFTRKASAEMQTRLTERLRELAICTNDHLDTQLTILGIDINASNRQRARQLYEELLHNQHNVKTTTFHAFCQEILRRFPLEADVPPGFELIEQTQSAKNAAWDILFNDLTKTTNSDIAQSIQVLFDYCGNLTNTKQALLSFLDKRVDWWLLSQDQTHPAKYASELFKSQLKLDSDFWQASDFFNSELVSNLNIFNSLLVKHGGKANQNHAVLLNNIDNLISSQLFDTAFEKLAEVFLTQKEQPRIRKESKAQEKSMGVEGQATFLDIHIRVSDALLNAKEQQRKNNNYRVNCAWYNVGQYLLSIYQRIKQDMRVLDFDDLEWRTYQLLHHANAAAWVQYKLDARIDHLLVDEFQDTNPIQWRLILPILEELSAGESERNRSAFLVGDEKQSIYRFRRAEPKLFSLARYWMQDRLEAFTHPLSTSWRSAPAIIDFVNLLFSDGKYADLLIDFPKHRTHLDQLYGGVEILPLVEPDQLENNGAETSFRNPLESPRQIKVDTRYFREGQLIAAQIQSLIDNRTTIGSGEHIKAIGYDDIIILMRSRTHLHHYERAFREAGIPYSGTNGSSLLDSLEIKDMVALLETLVSPYNNLALAHVLRSPIFNANHSELEKLSSLSGNWMDNLISNNWPKADSALQRAKELLPQWQALVGRIPVHDTLDKIFFTGELFSKYAAAVPKHLKQRVMSNLQQFIELALDMDSGRYPSMERFLWELIQARSKLSDSPDQASHSEANSAVRIMTIHAAKGLESPVVFLADSSRCPESKQAYEATVYWPIESQTPERFFLKGNKQSYDNFVKQTLSIFESENKIEEANLLYVAITRAKQFLYITGAKPNTSKSTGWYGDIVEQCTRHGWDGNNEPSSEPHLIKYCGEKIPARKADADLIATKQVKTNLPPNHFSDIELQSRHQYIAPSHSTIQISPRNLKYTIRQVDENKKVRGQIVHRALEHLNKGLSKSDVKHKLNYEFNTYYDTLDKIEHLLEEAWAAFSHPSTQFLFSDISTANYEKPIDTYNEVPINYQISDNETVTGVIDRLLIFKNHLIIVDYKTQQITSTLDINELCHLHTPQISFYVQGIQKIWPNVEIQSYLLFTHNIQLAEVPIN